MKSNEIRNQFLSYFNGLGHTIVQGSSLIPEDDPSILFTNAGMVQFKDIFLAKKKADYRRAVSIQPCLRAGGKHNDLDNVGYTARHHTFFEMLGNFSFGDYFKAKAIHYAWDFLTKVLSLPKKRLWITVFKDDDEAADIWLKGIGVSRDRFSRCGEEDNFWQMGATGPCGPCSEIFYDHGPAIAGGSPGSQDSDGDRYVEIWNLVFMQYERLEDATLVPLANPSVDTGMGLERLAAVLQGTHDNFQTDLFKPLIDYAAHLIGCDPLHRSLRVIADHIRSTSFLIADGVRPSNEGQGYVLRRIIRRAVRHGYQLGLRQAFFYQMLQPLLAIMGTSYLSLSSQAHIIPDVIRHEESQFLLTIDQGMKLLNQSLSQLKQDRLPAELVFKLYDTYGFPIDITRNIAKEHGIAIDEQALNQLMEQQRQQSKSHSQFQQKSSLTSLLADGEQVQTQFKGYDHLTCEAVIEAIYVDGQLVDQISSSEKATLVLDNTPFYPEGGGQVGDSGKLGKDHVDLFMVEDCQKQQGVILHIGYLKSGMLSVGDTLSVAVDAERREQITLNHSATHLLHVALRQILGHHVSQKGSLVTSRSLRFDFSHPKALNDQQIRDIEELVNHYIRSNAEKKVALMSVAEAKKQGALALFGEKYDDEVRVLSFGDFSKELCGGTHVARTGDIGLFKITHQTGIASGVRRIEAVTGARAIHWLSACKKDDEQKILDYQQKLKQQQKLFEQLQKNYCRQISDNLLSKAKTIANIKLLVAKLSDLEAKELRSIIDRLRDKLPQAVVVLASVIDEKVVLISFVSQSLTGDLHAGKLIHYVAKQIGGGGGGRADMAEAGGSRVDLLDEALASVEGWMSDICQLT